MKFAQINYWIYKNKNLQVLGASTRENKAWHEAQTMSD